MFIQVISDTHNSPYDIADDADVVVHAGDLSNGLHGLALLKQKCEEKNKNWVCALGNHDYLHNDYLEVQDILKKYYPNNVLRSDNTITIDGYTFVGGTLFTNFRQDTTTKRQFKANKLIASQSIVDFSRIYLKDRCATPEDYVRWYKEHLSIIEEYGKNDKTIVVTHFPPNPVCTSPKYEGDLLNPYFINNIDLKGYKTWICGHSHNNLDIVHDGCRVVMNPLGYPMENTGYKNNNIILV